MECGCVRFTRENKEGDGNRFLPSCFRFAIANHFHLKIQLSRGGLFCFYILSVINLDILDTACRLDSSFNSSRDKIIRDYKEQVIVET